MNQIYWGGRWHCSSDGISSCLHSPVKLRNAICRLRPLHVSLLEALVVGGRLVCVHGSRESVRLLMEDTVVCCIKAGVPAVAEPVVRFWDGSVTLERIWSAVLLGLAVVMWYVTFSVTQLLQWDWKASPRNLLRSPQQVVWAVSVLWFWVATVVARGELCSGAGVCVADVCA